MSARAAALLVALSLGAPTTLALANTKASRPKKLHEGDRNLNPPPPMRPVSAARQALPDRSPVAGSRDRSRSARIELSPPAAANPGHPANHRRATIHVSGHKLTATFSDRTFQLGRKHFRVMRLVIDPTENVARLRVDEVENALEDALAEVADSEGFAFAVMELPGGRSIVSAQPARGRRSFARGR